MKVKDGVHARTVVRAQHTLAVAYDTAADHELDTVLADDGVEVGDETDAVVWYVGRSDEPLGLGAVLVGQGHSVAVPIEEVLNRVEQLVGLGVEHAVEELHVKHWSVPPHGVDWGIRC
jgi:hypothetical protein